MSPKKATLKYSSILMASLALSSVAFADSDDRDARKDQRIEAREQKKEEREGLKLAVLIQPSSHGTAGEALATSPWFYTVDQRGYPDLHPMYDIKLEAYLDPACTVPATHGTFAAKHYRFYREFGLAIFYDVHESAAGGIYLKATAHNRGAACTSLVNIGAAAADHLLGLQGSGQTGVAGTVLSTAAQVQVLDTYDNPVSGVNLSFTATKGGGSATPASAASNATGIATSNLKLGTTAGTDTFEAALASGKLPGSPAKITFTETATASGGTTAPTQLALAGPSSQQAGACSTVFTVTAESKTGAAAKETSALAITLSGLGSGSLYSDSACSIALSSLSIAAGQSQATFYFKDKKAETAGIAAAATGLTSSQTVSDSVLAGAASALGYSTLPSITATAGQALAIQPTLKILDAFGNAVSAGSFSIALGTFSDFACTAAVTGTLSAAANPLTSASGSATFSGVTLTQAGTVYLLASANGLTSACSKAIAVGAAAPSKINIIAGNSESAAVGTQLGISPQVKVTDAFGNAVSGAGLVFAVTAGGASVTPATATSDANGLAQAALTLGNAPGTDSLSVSATGAAWAPSSSPASASFSETAVAGAPATMALSGPSALQAGSCSAYVISLSDSLGNASPASSALSVALGGQGKGSFFADAGCSQAEGSASFAQGASSQTFYFSDNTAETLLLAAGGSGSALGTSSLAVSVAPGAASKLVFSAQPSGATPAGAAFATQPAISAQDRFGNLATSASGSVALAAYSDAACSSLAGGAFQIAANPLALSGGQASFSGASYNQAGVLYLGAASSGLSSACSVAFAISAAAADHLISIAGGGQTTSVGLAVAIAPQVKVVDAYGNAVSGVSIAFTAGAGSGSASPATATSDGNGLAQTAWTLGTAPGNDSLAAQGSSLAGFPSQITFSATATPGSPSVLILSGPSSQVAGACSGPFGLSTQDRYGNSAPTGTALQISLAGAGAGSFFADGACSLAESAATIAAGSASGSFYFKDTHSENLILTASGSALSGSTLPFTVQSGPASALSYSTQPSGTGTAGQALAAQPQLLLKDAYGNTVTSATNAVALAAYGDAACSVPAAGTLGASSNPLAASGGTASFSGISETLAGQFYLGASSSGLSGACSSVILISAGAASQLVSIQGDGQSATIGTAVAINPTVKASDSYGNVVSGAAVTFTVSAGGGSVSAASASTDSTGQASTQFTMGISAGTDTMTASLGAGGAGGAGRTLGSGASVSFNETATPRAPAALFLIGPASSAAGACSGPFAIQLLDNTGAATVAQSTMAVSLSGNGNGVFYSDAGCASPATSASIAAGSGSAQIYFSDTTAESLTLVAQAGSIPSASALTVVSPAAAAKIIFLTQPSSSVIAGAVLATLPTVGATDAYGNAATSFAANVTLGAFSDSTCSTAAIGKLSATANPVAASGGQASFAGVSYDTAGVVYLQAASNGLVSGCSQAVAVAVAMSLSAGTAHTCALQNGNVKCWGFNSAGSLGNGNNTNFSTPQQVLGLATGAIALGTGGQHGCASTSTGLLCWGLNFSGQLGNGTNTNSNVPVAVPGIGGGISQIVGGDSHTCVLINGAIQCWGDNTYGQLGNGTNNSSTVPVLVVGLPGVVQSIAAASETTCAVLTTGAAYCWGYNDCGQLGNGTTQDSNLPVLVQGLGAVTSIAPGIENTCALVSGGVYCWGQNDSGQLGNGSFNDSLVPVRVSGFGSNVTKLLSGGENFSCAILSTGAVQCWGQNSRGQLGDNKNSGAQSNVPVQVVGLTNGYQLLHAGYVHACASDGTHIKCWGFGSSGQLGDGLTVESNVPVAVTGY